MKNQKIKLSNPFNFQVKPEHREHPKGKSLTVANDALSIQEILEKWTHGVDPMLSRIPSYTEDPDTDDLDLHQFENLDITDKAELSREAGETMQRVKNYKPKKEAKKGGEEDDPKE